MPTLPALDDLGAAVDSDDGGFDAAFVGGAIVASTAATAALSTASAAAAAALVALVALLLRLLGLGLSLRLRWSLRFGACRFGRGLLLLGFGLGWLIFLGHMSHAAPWTAEK
jgi:hypothetical protein